MTPHLGTFALYLCLHAYSAQGSMMSLWHNRARDCQVATTYYRWRSGSRKVALRGGKVAADQSSRREKELHSTIVLLMVSAVDSAAVRDQHGKVEGLPPLGTRDRLRPLCCLWILMRLCKAAGDSCMCGRSDLRSWLRCILSPAHHTMLEMSFDKESQRSYTQLNLSYSSILVQALNTVAQLLMACMLQHAKHAPSSCLAFCATFLRATVL